MINKISKYNVNLIENDKLRIKANRFQQRSLIISPIIFAILLLIVIYILLPENFGVKNISIVVITGFGSYLFTIHLIRKMVWDTIKKYPPYFYGFSILITTLVGIFIPIIIIYIDIFKINSGFFIIIEIGFLLYSIIYLIILGIFMTSIRSDVVYDLVSGDAIYSDYYLIFPYSLHRSMNFKKNNNGNLQFILKTLKLVEQDAITMSRTSIVLSFSEDEFIEFNEFNKEYLLALYDPISNPELESVLCFKGKKDEILNYLELLRKYISIEVIKLQDSKITTNIFGNIKRTINNSEI